MFFDRRLHGIWVGERFAGMSQAEFLTWFFSVLVYFLGVKYAHFSWFFQDTRALHGGRWFLSVQQPPAAAVPVLHTQRVA